MKNTVVIGVAHPKGENESYDGFFYKESEFKRLADDLVNKPVFFEHDENCRVGNIISAWPGIGKNRDKELFVMFELDNTTLPGILADRMIQDEHICDLSLGHKVTIENSEGCKKVVGKDAIEVSICEKGARPNTHIYQVYRYNSKKYINKYKSMPSNITPKTMSENNSEVDNKVETKVPETTEEKTNEPSQVQVTESILEQFRHLQERNRAMESELEQFKAKGKRLREETLQNGVRDFVMKTIEEEEGLRQYSDHMKKLMEDMVEAESATPMLQLLKCCAKRSSQSVTELENAYQEKKEYEQQIKKLRLELEGNKTPMFKEKHERIQAVASSGSSSDSSSGSASKLGIGPGLKQYNPNLWQEISNDILKHC